MLGAGVIVFFIVLYIITLLISILIIRWVFRINDIVNELEAIRKLLQKGPFTATIASPSSITEGKRVGEPKVPSPQHFPGSDFRCDKCGFWWAGDPILKGDKKYCSNCVA
jgi:hypothetical protein